MKVSLVLLLVAPALAGCATQSDGNDEPRENAWVPCVHPWPCGDGSEWPTELAGPFDLLPVERLRIPSHDGVELETYLYRPAVNRDVPLPTVLWSQPYTGGCAFTVLVGSGACMPAGDSSHIRDGGYRVNVRLLVENGYAVVVSNVRGTGNSGGCFSFGGLAEQEDQSFLVEWIAEQAWSNGRVAMYGHSYHGYTPWMAAVQSPPALKTVVASGILTDPYIFYHTPQGAPLASGGGFAAGMAFTVNNVPPVGGGPQHATLDHVGVYPERLCPGFADTFGEGARAQFTDYRNGPWWQERRVVEHFDQISTAVLVSHGFNDDTGHAFQDDIVWNSLASVPKRFILGQWGHDLPPPEALLANAPFGTDWHGDVLVPWLDFWLKGIGTPDRLGNVNYQSQDGAWRETTTWPPAEVRDEVLFLTSDGLTPHAGDADKTFVAGESPLDAACLPARSPAIQDGEQWVVYATTPLAAPVTVAGNPFAFLELGSSLPGGIVSVGLFDISPDGPCKNVMAVAGGAADLRFHEGNFQGRDFPTGTATQVRVDLHNDAWTFQPDHRLAIILSGTGWWPNMGQPYHPQITVHAGGSHIVLPLVDGTLGGAAPLVDYPSRPFALTPQQ